MPRIKFTKDVPNESGAGLLYAAGYEADVSYVTARKWVQSGCAVDPDAPAPKAEKPAVVEPVSEPAKPVKRKMELRTTAIKPADVLTADIAPVSAPVTE